MLVLLLFEEEEENEGKQFGIESLTQGRQTQPTPTRNGLGSKWGSRDNYLFPVCQAPSMSVVSRVAFFKEKNGEGGMSLLTVFRPQVQPAISSHSLEFHCWRTAEIRVVAAAV